MRGGRVCHDGLRTGREAPGARHGVCPITEVQVLDGHRDPAGGYRVDAGRGGAIGRMPSEWFSRPADERYLSLSELYGAVRGRSDRSRTRTVESAAVRVEASREAPDRLTFALPTAEAPVAPTHWSFGQLASLIGAPAAYLRQLPAPLAGINLQHGSAHPPRRAGQDAGGGRRARGTPAPTTAASTTMSLWMPCAASPTMARAIPAGKCRALSTGRKASAIPASTSRRTPPRSPPRTWTSSCSWWTNSTPSRPVGCRMALPTSSSGGFYIAGTRRLAPRRWASPASISGRSARTAICGAGGYRTPLDR